MAVGAIPLGIIAACAVSLAPNRVSGGQLLIALLIVMETFALVEGWGRYPWGLIAAHIFADLCMIHGAFVVSRATDEEILRGS